MKVSQRYMLALMIGASFIYSPSNLYAGKKNNLDQGQGDSFKSTQSKKRKVSQAKGASSESSQSSNVKRKKSNEGLDGVKTSSLSLTSSSLSNNESKSETIKDKWNLAKSLFDEEEWNNIINDVSEAVKIVHGPIIHQEVLDKMSRKAIYKDYIDALRNMKGQIGRISHQLIKNDKSNAALALLCAYVHSKDVRESIASIYEANAYETLKLILRNYRVLDPLEYSDTGMGCAYGFQEGRESLAGILAKALKAHNHKFFSIFFEEKYDRFVKTLNYTFTRNHPLSIKVTESAFHPNLANLVGDYLSNYKFGFLTGAIKARDEGTYRTLKQGVGDFNTLFLRIEFKKHFLQTLLEASNHSNFFQKELESQEEQEPVLIKKLKEEQERKKPASIAKKQVVQLVHEAPDNRPQNQLQVVRVVQPLNAMQPKALPQRIIILPHEREEIERMASIIQGKQPELNNVLREHLGNYEKAGQGKSFREYLQSLHTPHANSLLREMELARQAADQLPAIIQFAKEYHNYVYENPNASASIHKIKAEEFRALNKENPLLAAFELLEQEAAEARWKFSPYNMRDATSQDLQNIDEIIDSFKKINEQFTNSDLYGTLLTVRTFLANNTEICLELLASGKLFSCKYKAIKPGDIITHPEQDDANLEERAWNAYYTLISLWNKINEITKPEERQYIISKLIRDYTKAPCIEAQSRSLDTWITENKALLIGVKVEEEIENCVIFDKPIDSTLYRILNGLVSKLKLMDAKYQEEETAFKQAQKLNDDFKKIEEIKKQKLAENSNNTVREMWGMLDKGKLIAAIPDIPQDLVQEFFQLQSDRFKRIQERYNTVETEFIDAHLKEISGKILKLVGRQATDGLITHRHVHNIFESLMYSTEFLQPS